MNRKQRLKLNFLSGLLLGLIASTVGGITSLEGWTIILVGSFIVSTIIRLIGDYMEVNK